MRRIYRRWMEDWENRLCFRTNNRVVRPFEWGAEWSSGWPAAQRHPRNGDDPETYLKAMSRAAVENSDEFFGYRPPPSFHLEGDELRFDSAAPSHCPENNLVRARWFPAKTGERAVVVLPHWNAQPGQHVGLCQGIRALGISALRISLPYHDARMPPELSRADYAVSSNVARTVDATRQAVIDVRSCFDWLEQRGYTRLGIVGTSLGSCYAFLASAHDPRIRVNVFNHCSSYFADVVWTGLSTQHIRQGIEEAIELDRLRAVWDGISPVNYMAQYARWAKKSKFIYARFDTTFLPRYSEDIVRLVREQGIDHSVAILPCGHYTVGETPFKYLDGYHICSFLKRWL